MDRQGELDVALGFFRSDFDAASATFNDSWSIRGESYRLHSGPIPSVLVSSSCTSSTFCDIAIFCICYVTVKILLVSSCRRNNFSIRILSS